MARRSLKWLNKSQATNTYNSASKFSNCLRFAGGSCALTGSPRVLKPASSLE
jgi:hypothetical protein